ncbi:hypothetical protein FSP39_016882 [Pinctada imbricata]|uniref:MD-2-related lipid-recognition domain-containing protein n=1 Tax=Pinctada imbricata TaxID=66713 RepID=A0AA89C7M0_PINIB|nr:hypothetical protein FSP39_016882 [Pinctada imbricata]
MDKFQCKKITFNLGKSPRKLIHVVESSVHLNPYPVQIPGHLTVDGSLQILGPISGHNLKAHVLIKKKLLGNYQKVPCVANVGSCTYDVCDLIGEGSNDQCADYYLKNHFPCHCPLPNGTFSFAPTSFTIPEATGAFSWIASGEYTVDVQLVDESTKEEKGCYHVDIELEDKSGGFLFG